MREITITTVQGLGDIIWVLQKLTPKYDRINLRILCVAHDAVQQRAKGFLELLPCVGSIEYVEVSDTEYNRVASTRYALPEEDGEYAVNKQLESGTRIDADGPVNWDLRFAVESGVTPAPFNVLYVSGNKSDRSWSTEQWTHFVSKLYQIGYLQRDLYIIGAEYDTVSALPIAAELLKHNVHTRVFTDLTPSETVRVIEACTKFVGYQSGLSVIADMYDRPQIMLYFPMLERMMYTWCKPRDEKLYQAFTFDTPVGAILNEVTR